MSRPPLSLQRGGLAERLRYSTLSFAFTYTLTALRPFAVMPEVTPSMKENELRSKQDWISSAGSPDSSLYSHET